MTQMTSNEVELCREVPIHLLIGNSRLNKKVKIVCPYHSEKTGSCVIYPKGGYYCYGCGSHGNTVDFCIKMGATFEEAINDLRKYI